jgi:hypothetical protein
LAVSRYQLMKNFEQVGRLALVNRSNQIFSRNYHIVFFSMKVGDVKLIRLKNMNETELLKPSPGPAYRLLDAFIGTWHTTGNMKTSENEPDIVIDGSDSYEWMPGGYFVIHKVDVMMGQDRKECVEIIGYDAATNSYPMHSYDHKGETSVMHASEHHGIWTFLSETMRFTGSFSKDGNTVSGIWENSVNDIWEFLMDIKLTRC